MEQVKSVLKFPPFYHSKYSLLIEGAAKLGLKGTRFHLVMVLWMRTEKNQTIVYYKNKTIAKLMGINIRNVERNVAALIKKGFILPKKRYRTYRELDLGPLYMSLLNLPEPPPQKKCHYCHQHIEER